jgi:hypothetical protein
LHTTLASIASVLVFLQAGYLALRLISGTRIRPRVTAVDSPGISESLALSYGIGVGLMSTELLVLSLLGIRFTTSRVLVPWAVAWALHLSVQIKLGQGGSRPPFPRPLEVRTVALLTPLAATVLVMLFRATFMPAWGWDEWAIWDLKARAFYHDGGVIRFVSDSYYGFSRGLVAYPILCPLAGTLMYVVLGSPHGPIHIVPLLFYLSMLVVFFTTLRRLGSSTPAAALLTTGLGFLPNVLEWTVLFQAESPLIFYALTFACYLFLYSREPRPWYLLVAAASAGFLTQVRPDGLAIIVPGVLWLAGRARHHGAWPLGIFAAVVASIYTPWFLLSRFVASVPGGVSLGAEQIQAGFQMVPDVLATMLTWMSDSPSMGPYTLLFPLALLMIVTNWRRYAHASGEGVLLLTVLFSLAPHVVLLITVPYWLTVGGMSRYLLAFTCLVYLLFSLHSAESAAAPSTVEGEGEDVNPTRRLGVSAHDTAGGIKLALRVSIALAAAVLLTSAPHVLSRTRSRAVSWDFRDGVAGWADETGAAAQTAAGALALPGNGQDRWVVSPRVRIDADLTRTIRLVARGTRGATGRLTLSWKRQRAEYGPDQIVSTWVAWTGVYQPVVVGPPWRGTVEELRVSVEGEGPVLVRAIELEPKWLSMIALALRTSASKLSTTVALAMAFLGAAGLLGTRANIQRMVSIGFATIVLVFWILPGVSHVPMAATEGRGAPRPIGLARQVLELWNGFGRYPLDERLERLEAAIGRPHFWPLIRETTARCGTQGNVVVWASSGNADFQPGGYLFQRSVYLLYPSKVFVAHEPEVLTKLLRQEPASALIVYGIQPPPGVGGSVSYSSARDFGVVCAPVADPTE